MIIGVLFVNLPSIMILLLKARVTLTGASELKFHEPENFERDNPQQKGVFFSGC